MSLEVYCSISKQHRYIQSEAEKYLIEFLNAMGYDSLLFNSFQGGRYEGADAEVGKPDILSIFIGTKGDFIGKGSYTETKYARTKGIPVIAVCPIGADQGIYLVTGLHLVDEKDWKYYTTPQFKPMTMHTLAEVFSNFGLNPPATPATQPEIKNVESESKLSNSMDDMLLI
jgi:hypothetical protein